MSYRHVAQAVALVELGLILCAPSPSQTTQGLITGRVFDKYSLRAAQQAIVRYVHLATEASGSSAADENGYYTFAFLSPGTYRLRAEAPGYQAQEIYEVVLAVAARVEIGFPLRPLNDLWEAGTYRGVVLPRSEGVLPFFGPDVQSGHSTEVRLLPSETVPLQATMSYVIDTQQLANLPLSGRDTYTLLVTLPGVTADNATGRGIGLSVNGQRSSFSNFLLDGTENNDYLITGPLTTLPPEAIQEYRVSTNNYSAEFGRTGGFVANAVTRSGGNSYHGVVYSYLSNAVLNANSFQRNLKGIDRAPQKELRAGYSLGGPIKRDRFFFSSAFEQFSSRNRQEPQDFQVPVMERFRSCPEIPADSQAMRLLERFPPPPATPLPLAPGQSPCNALSAPLTGVEVPVTIDNTLALGRVDFMSSSGRDRLMTRFAYVKGSRPDFVFSLYEGMNTPLSEGNTGISFSYTRSISPNAVNELRFGWRHADLHWTRPEPAVPTLRARVEFELARLPGSEANYQFMNAGQYWEASDSVLMSFGRHVLTAGGSILLRRFESELTFLRDGIFDFANLLNFGKDVSSFFRVSVSRELLPELGQPGFVQPSYDRDHSNNQFYAFFQDDVQATRRLNLNFGFRYEAFGSNKDTGGQNGYLQLGSGVTIEERISGASLVFDHTTQRSVHKPDWNNVAGRFGFAYDFFGTGSTLFRGAYGIFYDRGFDNLTQAVSNNNLDTIQTERSFDLTQGLDEVLLGLTGSRLDFPGPLWVDENLRNPIVQSWFGGVQYRVGSGLLVEVAHSGALSRKLIASDLVNRRFSVERTGDNPNGRLNPEFPDILYRSNSGSSNYIALTSLLTYRASSLQIQASYTYGHAIDNQSDPLQGHYSNLSFAQVGQAQSGLNLASFTRQFDSRVDRGSADFDQRQNFIFYSIWELPSVSPRGGWIKHLLSDWQISSLLGFRSGFPYSVVATGDISTPPPSGGLLSRNRADLLAAENPTLRPGEPASGGLRIVDPSAFRDPPANQIGNLGRNALRAPGFWSVDLSLAKSFIVRPLGEQARLQVRVEVFNLFNHANLGSPYPFLVDKSQLGVALFGRQGQTSAFPATSPLNESPRQIQLQLKVYF